jgi:hypothetical protein
VRLPNTKAIVVYVDDKPKCLEEFSWLYKTWRLWGLDLEFDLVAYCNPRAVEKLPAFGPALVVKEMPSLSETDPFWSAYPFVNSFAMFNRGQEISSTRKQYTHILRTDCDVFLTQHLLGHAPNKTMLGQGGYIRPAPGVGERTIENLNRLREKWKLPNGHITHVGASIFGPASHVIIASIRHFELTRDILNSEWADGEGDWEDGWFKGVSSMYAIDLAVNELFTRQNLILYALDDHCWDNIFITKSTLHIHAWHSNQYFSKHEWFKGNYEKLVLDRVPNVTSQYCHWIASNTLEELQEVVATSGSQT